jgi:hypothetical protein
MVPQNIYVVVLVYLKRGGTLQHKIEVCGRQLVSPDDGQQIAALSNSEPLFPSTYYHSHSRHRWQPDA